MLLVNKLDLVEKWDVTVEDLRAATRAGLQLLFNQCQQWPGVREAFAALAKKVLP